MFKKSFLLIFLLYMGLYLIYAHFNFKSLDIIEPAARSDKDHKACLTPTYPKIKTVKMLVISGGGVKGIIPLLYLNELEKKLNMPIAHIFNVFGGTSTGAIIVAGLTTPNADNQPRFTAHQILEDYIKLSKKVMHQSMARRLFSINGWIGPGHNIGLLHQQLQAIFGNDLPFKKLIGHVFFHNFNMNQFRMEIFNNHSCKNHFQEYQTADLLTAGAASNPFFSSVAFVNPKTHQKTHYLDPGMISNNIFPYVFANIKKTFPNMEKIIVVILDTGAITNVKKTISRMNYDQWGMLQWAYYLLMIFNNDTHHFVDLNLKDILSISSPKFFSYYYFNAKHSFNAFDASDNNINNILQAGQKSLKVHQKKLDALVKELQSSA